MSKIVKDTILFPKLISQVLEKCYDSQLYGIDNIRYEILHNKNDIFLVYYKTSLNNRIKIKINVIDFIESIKRPIFSLASNPPLERCVECKNVGDVFKYKRCKHMVHVECSLYAVKYNNRCKQCNLCIVEESIFTTKQDKIEKCSICLEDTDIVLYNCGHHFHESCLIKLSKTNSEYYNKCPMCRKKMLEYVNEIKQYDNIQFSLGNNREGICNIIINSYY